MAEDPLAPEVRGEVRGEQGGQLLGHVGVHAIGEAPGVLGGVDIEARPRAEVVAVVLTRKVEAARTRVGSHQEQALPRREALGAGLDGCVLPGAGEAREVGEHRDTT